MPEKASLSNPRNAFELFHKVYQAKDVTSQMHGIYCHVPEFLSRYQNIADFIQQGLEKYDRAFKNDFRSTNHRGVDALGHFFLKKNRIQFLEAASYERVQNTYSCSNCSNKATTFIKTCTLPCTYCPAVICCAQLVKEGSEWMPRCQCH